MKFDIVTPSYNHVRYLHEAIESVLSQVDQDVEVAYYIMDGASNDGSAEVIRSYERKLAYWRSEKDQGQSAAIAEGLRKGNGDIVAWINSDDFYPPGIFHRIARFFESHPNVDAVYGDCLMVNEHSEPVGLGTHIPVVWQDLFETPYLINQEATFVRRRAYEKVGGVDPTFWGAMDYDLWLRIFYEGRAEYIPEILGIHRFLPEQKSSTSVRYVEEMQKARSKFGKMYSLDVPPWPFSKDGRERIDAKWRDHWHPILQWIRKGCSEKTFIGDVCELWNLYSQRGVLSVRGGTSFGWVGPDTLYVLDRDAVGSTINWMWSSPIPGLTADRLALDLDGRSYDIEVQKKVSQELRLREDKRFTVMHFVANKSFVPALAGMGPAYFNLSLVSHPCPKGEKIISVQSMPCLPSFDNLNKQEYMKEALRSAPAKDSMPISIEASPIARHLPNRRLLKVAFFTSHPASIGSGSERLMYSTARALIERGHDARVYVMHAHLDKNPPFFVHQLPAFPLERFFERVYAKVSGWNDFLFPSTALLRLRRWIRSADLWHFNNFHGHYLSIPLLSLTSWTKRIIVSPVDQYLSTGHCPYTMGCERFVVGCGSCERIDEPWPGISRDSTHAMWRIKRLSVLNSRFNMMFHTQALADHYEKTFVRCRPSKVLQYGVDINCFRPLPRTDCAKKLGVEPSTRFVVGLLHSYVFEPRKGILSIITRLGDLAKQFPGQIGLLVVGHGSHLLKDILPQELPLTALPYLRHPHELANALNLCDVLLYPTKAENLSLSCLSALACGVPVISYDAGGQKEAVKSGLNGFIVDIKDVEGMIAAVVEMMKDPVLSMRLSEGARDTAERYFDFDRYVDELIQYYYEILEVQ